ncbi:MAG: hypothetical protein VXA68_09065 [Gammaproteobacteria bacterium]
MSDKNGTVIVTSPAWEGHSSPLGASLAHLADKYLVNVVQSPVMQLEMVNDAVRRAVLRELADWDEVKADYAITVVCSTPEAPDALEQFDDLCVALQLREDRLKFAAIDQETAISLSEVCHLKEISKFHFSSVMTPETPGSIKELTDLISKREEERELCLVFEPAESSGLIAKTLIGNGLRAIRMGFYKYRPTQMAMLPPTDNQSWWVVVNDAIAVTDIARGLKRQNMNFSNVRWIGCRPSIGIALKKILPNAEFVEVSELRPDVILDRIKNHINPAL